MNLRLIRVGLMIGVAIAARDASLAADKVKLADVHGRDVLQFIRTAVPEIDGGKSQNPVDLSTLMQLHERLERDRGFEEEEQWRDTRRSLEHVMRQTLGKVELPDLSTLALGDGEKNRGDCRLIPAFCRRWIETEVATICADPAWKPILPLSPPAIPKRYSYVQGTNDNGVALTRALGPFAILMASPAMQKTHGQYAAAGEFRRFEDTLLRGRNEKAADELLRIEWHSDCGTGLAAFENHRMTSAFMGLLRERRIGTALGVSFFVPDAPAWMREPGEPFDPWRADLLNFCGLDWEEAMISAGRWDYLAAMGSERGARQLIARSKSTGSGNSLDLQFAASFLIPGRPENWPPTDRRKFISPQTQEELFALIDSTIRDGAGGDAITILEGLRRPETIPALRRFLKHRSGRIAWRAAQVLAALGEKEQAP